MAHEIDHTTGIPAFAFVGAPAWHGLGRQMGDWDAIKQEIAAGKWPGCETPIDVWAKAAALDFHVDLAPVAFKPNGHWEPSDDYRMTYRTDTRKAFKIVSDGYQVFQPRQALEFMNDCIESHGMKLDTAGALFDGAQIFVLAKNEKVITIKGQDILKPYLLCSTSFDRSMSSRFAPTVIRVVCKNTQNASMAQDRVAVAIPHSTKVDVAAVKRRLGLVDATFAKYEEDANRLAEFKPSREQVSALMLDWFGKPADKEKPVALDNLTGQSRKIIADVETCIVSSPGSGLDSSRGTAWGVLQGVTNFVNHQVRAKSDEQRTFSALFDRGDGAMRNAAADLLALALAKTHTGLLADVLDATAAQ